MRSHLIFLCSLIVAVYAQYGPEILGDDPITGLTGTDVKIVCRQPSVNAGNLTWKREDDVPLVDNGKYDISVNSTDSHTFSYLTIKDAQLSDNGEYKCGRASQVATVIVALSMDADITIDNVAGDFRLAKGTTIECKSSDPDVPLTWSKDGTDLVNGKQSLNEDDVDDLEVKNNQVVLLSADPILAGEYICTADLGTDTKSVSQYIVGELDVFTPKSIKVSEGEDGHMECRVRSISEAPITWLVNGTEIQPNDKYIINEKEISSTESDEVISTLTIKKVTLEDGRPTNYTCSVTNMVDDESREIILRIRDRLAALWPFIGIVSEVVILIVIILIHEACTKGEDIGEVEDDEEDHLLQKNRNTITRDGERETRMRGTNN